MASRLLTKCVRIAKFGHFGAVSADQLTIDKHLGPRQLLLKLEVAGVNFADLYTVKGLFLPRGLKPPFVMGRECVAIAQQLGSQVSNISVGDRVVCISDNSAGMWSEYLVVDDSNCWTIPDQMSPEDGSTILNYVVAFISLFRLAHLQKGNKVFIHSVAGGVGWAATQLARLVDDVLIIGTSSTSKHSQVLQNGVDVALNSQDDFIEQVLSRANNGVDVILDNRSGIHFTNSRRMLAPLGTIVHLGANSAVQGAKKDPICLLKTWWGLKNVSVIDLVMENHTISGLNLDTFRKRNPNQFKEIFSAIVELYLKKKIAPRIDSTWTFDNAKEALGHLANRGNVGKIILKPN